MAAGGSLVAVPDGGQSVTAPRQAARCPLLPAGLGWAGLGTLECAMSPPSSTISHQTLCNCLLGFF